MSDLQGYPLIPETEMDGFVFGTITPLGEKFGAGVLQGPDGSRAGLQWELSDSPFIMRITAPDGENWGVYRVGFTCPVDSVSALSANLADLLPRLRILYSRARVN